MPRAIHPEDLVRVCRGTHRGKTFKVAEVREVDGVVVDLSGKEWKRGNVVPIPRPEVSGNPGPGLAGLCECGCGLPTAKAGKKYRIGHDQKHKGKLLQAVDTGDAEAAAVLIEKGWRSREEMARRLSRAHGQES
jgi:hypothetical protein